MEEMKGCEERKGDKRRGIVCLLRTSYVATGAHKLQLVLDLISNSPLTHAANHGYVYVYRI